MTREELASHIESVVSILGYYDASDYELIRTAPDAYFICYEGMTQKQCNSLEEAACNLANRLDLKVFNNEDSLDDFNLELGRHIE